MDKNASGPRAGDSMEPKHLYISRDTSGTDRYKAIPGAKVLDLRIGDSRIDRLESALVELGHAVSKSDLGIGSRRHIELFWDLIGDRK